MTAKATKPDLRFSLRFLSHLVWKTGKTNSNGTIFVCRRCTPLAGFLAKGFAGLDHARAWVAGFVH
jgi:hypothetical protein